MKILVPILCVLLAGAAWAQAPSGNQKAATEQKAETPAAVAEGAKIDPAKEADIRRLLDVSGVREMMAQTMADSEKTARPALANNLPPGEYREKLIDLFFEKLHTKFDIQELLDQIVLIYDKHLSDEDIKGLAQFYQTPLGKKTLSVLPQVLSEAREAGTKLGERAGRESMLEVLTEHPDLAEAMKAAAKAQQPQ